MKIFLQIEIANLKVKHYIFYLHCPAFDAKLLTNYEVPVCLPKLDGSKVPKKKVRKTINRSSNL